jgi:hypothetical protein
VPTSYEFDRLAIRFEQQAEHLTLLPRRLLTVPLAEIIAGRPADLADLALQASAANLGDCAARFRELAILCRSRAWACRRYTTAVRAYRSQLADPVARLHADRPISPRWMEFG